MRDLTILVLSILCCVVVFNTDINTHTIQEIRTTNLVSSEKSSETQKEIPGKPESDETEDSKDSEPIEDSEFIIALNDKNFSGPECDEVWDTMEVDEEDPESKAEVEELQNEADACRELCETEQDSALGNYYRIRGGGFVNEKCYCSIQFATTASCSDVKLPQGDLARYLERRFGRM